MALTLRKMKTGIQYIFKIINFHSFIFINNHIITSSKFLDYFEYQSNIEKSIDLSKEAISYNIKNCSSWGKL